MICIHCNEDNAAHARHCHACGYALHVWRDWTIQRQLGQGGMGTAYLVERRGQHAVLKKFLPDVTRQERLQECRNLYMAAALGVTPEPIEAYENAIVMEYFIAEQTVPHMNRIITLLKHVTMLHNRHFVLVDIKPENLVTTNIGTLIIDLGSMVDLARDHDWSALAATPGYAAPDLYQGHITPAADAYAVAWCIYEFLGLPGPDPQSFGPPAQAGTLPDALAFVPMMLALDPAVRCTVREAFHRLTGPWIRLPNGDTIGSDLVRYEDWTSVMGATGVNSGGYTVQVSHDEIRAFCQRTGSRLPTLAELQWLATGTETQKASRDRPSRLVSDYGAAQCRRAVWQPTSDGYLFGGTAYADTDVQTGTPEAGNRMIGLRIVHETNT